jgi:signal peptidase II
MARANSGNMPETGRPPAGRYRLMLAWVLLGVVIAFADQGTKSYFGALLAPGEVRPVTGFFNLVLVFNRGAAFSLLADAPGWQRELFAGLAVAASALIVVLLARHSADRLFCAGLALILGGALGNLWDRIALGHVVDFLDFHAWGYHWPAFNLADSAITVGAALLILDGLRARKAPAD